MKKIILILLFILSTGCNKTSNPQLTITPICSEVGAINDLNNIVISSLTQFKNIQNIVLDININHYVDGKKVKNIYLSSSNKTEDKNAVPFNLSITRDKYNKIRINTLYNNTFANNDFNFKFNYKVLDFHSLDNNKQLKKGDKIILAYIGAKKDISVPVVDATNLKIDDYNKIIVIETHIK